MAFRGRVFAAGWFNTTLTTVYSVPTGRTAYVKYFHIHNETVTEDTLMMYAYRSGVGDLPIGRAALLMNESADVVDKDNSITLMEGDAIKLQSTVSSSGVSYIITGGEEY